MSSGNEPEKPTKNWNEYTATELRSYISRNFNKTDCSFVINDSKRELRSFKWMLCDMSPVLKEKLTDQKNGAKNFKSIPISDKNFETLLSYVHSKNFINRSFDFMLNLYESSKQYNSELLTTTITNEIGCIEPINNWIRYTAIACRDRDINPELFSTFSFRWSYCTNNKHQPSLVNNNEMRKNIESELSSNVETVLDFDLNLFRHFFEFVCSQSLSPILCFKIAETYILKHIFKGKAPGKIEEEDNLIIDSVNDFFKCIKFSEMCIEDFTNGPAKSALLSDQLKKYFCSLVPK